MSEKVNRDRDRKGTKDKDRTSRNKDGTKYKDRTSRNKDKDGAKEMDKDKDKDGMKDKDKDGMKEKDKNGAKEKDRNKDSTYGSTKKKFDAPSKKVFLIPVSGSDAVGAGPVADALTYEDIGPPFIGDYLKKNAYIPIKCVGSGNYAKVYMVRDVKSKRDLALKVIDRNKTSDHYQTNFLPQELHVLQKLKHPNIITVSEITQLSKTVLIFMEFAVNGSLGDYLRKNKAFPDFAARPIFSQMVDGLLHMHQKGIAHRDIKMENILLDADMNPKLTDFSFAIICREDNEKDIKFCTTFCGSPAFLSPEILLLTVDPKQPYNPLISDVWSLGICLYIMLNDGVPFPHFDDFARTRKDQLERRWHWKKRVSDKISKMAKDMVMLMLEPVPELRIKTKEIRQHHWYQSLE